jgi:hypothetical protein
VTPSPPSGGGFGCAVHAPVAPVRKGPSRKRRSPCGDDSGHRPARAAHRACHGSTTTDEGAGAITDVPRGNGIGVRGVPAVHARECACAPWPRCRVSDCASRTGLARARSWDRHQDRAVRSARVLELATPLARGHLEDAPVEPCLLADPRAGGLGCARGRAGHVRHAHVLDGDEAVVRGQVARERVGEVPAAPRLASLEARDLTDGAAQPVGVRATWCCFAEASRRAVRRSRPRNRGSSPGVSVGAIVRGADSPRMEAAHTTPTSTPTAGPVVVGARWALALTVKLTVRIPPTQRKVAATIVPSSAREHQRRTQPGLGRLNLAPRAAHVPDRGVRGRKPEPEPSTLLERGTPRGALPPVLVGTRSTSRSAWQGRCAGGSATQSTLAPSSARSWHCLASSPVPDASTTPGRGARWRGSRWHGGCAPMRSSHRLGAGSGRAGSSGRWTSPCLLRRWRLRWRPGHERANRDRRESAA